MESMHPLARFEKSVISVFRMDLQLHFFWSFFLTLLAVFWTPLLISGALVTVAKEWLDVVAQKGWSWGDFIWGMAGWATGLLFLNAIGFF